MTLNPLNRLSSNVKVIDLFSGAGGMSLGFSWEGFSLSAAMEVNKIYTKTHHLNFPNSCSVTADIRDLEEEKFSELTQISPKDTTVIIGGPPCQTFSTIGHPKIRSVGNRPVSDDHRNFLFEDYFRYVDFFRPQAFVIENVPNFVKKYNGKVVKEIHELSKILGYTVTSKVLNAVEFGVPQTRKRIFIVGLKNGNEFTFPEPTHAGSLKAVTTVRDAIEDMPKIYDGIRAQDLPYSKNEDLSPYQIYMRNQSGLVTNNVCRVSNDRAKRVFDCMKQGDRYMDLPKEVRQILPFREDIFHDRLKRLVFDQPSWTVIAHIGMDGYQYIHPTECRTLSVREAARIQSFPDHFEFVGNMREQYIQVGNSVPPILAKNLAAALAEQL